MERGTLHKIGYGGTEREVRALAETVARIAAGYGWVLESRLFTPAPAWQSTLARWLGSAEPRGRISVVFAYGPAMPPDQSGGQTVAPSGSG